MKLSTFLAVFLALIFPRILCGEEAPILAKIYEAQEQLESRPLKKVKEHKLLGVLNGEELIWVSIMVNHKGRVLTTDPQDCLAEKRGGNGVNTDYHVVCDGVQLPLLAGKLFDARGVEVVYTPHSPILHQREIQDAGWTYINGVIETAFKDLARLKVPSLAYPGRTVGEIHQERIAWLVKAIIINEHVGFHELREYGVQFIVEKVIGLLGANREKTYSHAISHAGAARLAQMMRYTYERVAKEFPSADINPNFREGTLDHTNAVKAMLCLIDTELKTLPEYVRERFLTDPETVEIFIPAFYHGGSRRTAHLIKVLGDAWDKPFTIPPVVGSKAFLRQTWQYLQKHVAIMLFFTRLNA